MSGLGQDSDKTQRQQVSNEQAAKGCFAVLVIVLVVGWLVVKWATLPDYDLIVRTQTIGLTTEIINDSAGQSSLTRVVAAFPEAEREERTRQLIDFWFLGDKPMLYPSEGVDADWLERDSARRIVKRRMLRFILEQVEEQR